jgi:transposase
MRQEILVGPERRRRWSDAEKILIVVEAARGGVSVAEVARRHDITRQQIYQWRSAMRQGRLVDENGGPFLAVEFIGAPGFTSSGADGGDVPPPPNDPGSDSLVEITLRKGRVLRAPVLISPALLTSLIRAAEAA